MEITHLYDSITCLVAVVTSLVLDMFGVPWIVEEQKVRDDI